MAYKFSADEVFEMAKQIERNGSIFYREAAKKIDGESEKNFLIELAKAEDSHEKYFEKIQSEFVGEEKASQIFEPVEEAVLYLKSIADTKVFFKKHIPENDIKKILISALEAEKESIIFYLGIKEIMVSEIGKSRIDNIIKEEMRHIRILSEKFMQN